MLEYISTPSASTRSPALNVDKAGSSAAEGHSCSCMISCLEKDLKSIKRRNLRICSL